MAPRYTESWWHGALIRTYDGELPMLELSRDPLLVEREKTYGSFKYNAETWAKLCQTGSFALNTAQKCALNMIYLKIARLQGDPNHKDTWDDIAGYAKLGSEACE